MLKQKYRGIFLLAVLLCFSMLCSAGVYGAEKKEETLGSGYCNLSIDYEKEAITGLTSGKRYEYHRDSSSKWYSVNNNKGEFAISRLIGSEPFDLIIREKRSKSQTPAQEMRITVPARRDAPSEEMIFVYDVYEDKAILSGPERGMEYRILSKKEWTPVGESDVLLDIPKSNTRCYIRYQAGGREFASKNATCVLLAYGTPPSIQYDKMLEKLKNISSRAEWRVDDQRFRPAETTEKDRWIDVSYLIDNIPKGGSITLEVRSIATEEKPHSRSKKFTIYSRYDPPKGISFDKEKCVLMGVSSKICYRKVGTEKWYTPGNKPISMKTLIGEETNVSIEVATKPTKTGGAMSNPIVIHLY